MIHIFNMTALRTFSSDCRKEWSQVIAWNHLLPSLVHDMPPCNTRLKLCHAVKCYSLLLDFTMLFVSSRAKVTITKCVRVIYIMTVVGICKCNIDWCHTHTNAHTYTCTHTYLPQHCGIQMNTKIVLMLLSIMTGEKKMFHVTTLIRTMQRSKAEAEEPRYTAAYPISNN